MIIGVRPGRYSIKLRDETDTYTVAEQLKLADIMILAPDEIQQRSWQKSLQTWEAGNAVGFAHGFNIHLNYQVPADVDVFMCALKVQVTWFVVLLKKDLVFQHFYPVYQELQEIRKILLWTGVKVGAARVGLLEATYKKNRRRLFGEQLSFVVV